MRYDIDYSNMKIYETYIFAIADGNKVALEELYSKTRNYVYGYALSMLSNVNDAEDVMQDTYVNIYKYASMYNPRNKPLAWILTITKNLCLNKLKQKKRRKETDISDIEHIITKDKRHMHHDYTFARTILEELTEEEKKIIILSSVEGLKYREIAHLLDLNLSTVLSKYHRAMKKIRMKYKEA